MRSPRSVRCWRSRTPLTPEARLLVVTHNVWSGQSPKSVRDNLSRLVVDVAARWDEKPHVLLLQEAKRFDGTLTGYVRVAHDGGHADNSNCVMLVRADVGIRFPSREVTNSENWVVVSHDKTHPPRVWPAPTLIYPPTVEWDVVDVHRVPARGANDDAWAAEHQAIVDYADQRPDGRPLVLGGDWNGKTDDPRPLSITALAGQIDARVRVKGIDGFLLRDCAGEAVKLPDKYGSDHHKPVVIKLRRHP